VSAVAKRAHRCAIALGWSCPFLLPPLTQAEIHEDNGRTRTLCVGLRPDGTLEIFVNSDYAKTLSDRQMAGVMAHELLHPTLMHFLRMGDRNIRKWNRATDRAINHVLRVSNVELPPGALYPFPGNEDFDAESHYDVEPDQKSDSNPGTEDVGVGQGCGIIMLPKASGSPAEAPEGQGGGGDPSEGGKPQGEAPSANGEGSLTPQAAQVWKEIGVQVRAQARGTAAGHALARLLSPPPPRSRFENVIRSAASLALANHGRDTQTWSKKARRGHPRILLPGWAACKARLAVVIDASGSVSDEMLTRAVVETVRLQNTVAGLKIFFVVHDSCVYTAEWVKASSIEKLRHLIKGRGGTCFEEAYQKVDEAGRFDACVHLTDGEIGLWPEPPKNARKFIVARLGKGGDQAPPGAIDIPVEV
jgi:hypothetical protein